MTKYITLSDYSYQLIWTRNLLNEISFNILTSYLYSNNLSSLFWKSNSIQEEHSKYINICYYYIKDLIKNKQIKLYYINKKKILLIS